MRESGRHFPAPDPALHVASWIEIQCRDLAAPTVKQHLAATHHLFDWLVTGKIVPINPAASLRGPPSSYIPPHHYTGIAMRDAAFCARTPYTGSP